MIHSRRRFLHMAAGAVALPALPRIARAQAYPTRPVRIIVPFAAGGGTDVLARLMGQWLSERLGQPFIVENRPGGGSNIGTEAVVRASPDGYTLLMITPSNTTNATLYDKLSFNFIRDIAPVANTTSRFRSACRRLISFIDLKNIKNWIIRLARSSVGR
jgi:tripartite-type tricarboxylate transporter receptor subunit TctC